MEVTHTPKRFRYPSSSEVFWNPGKRPRRAPFTDAELDSINSALLECARVFAACIAPGAPPKLLVSSFLPILLDTLGAHGEHRSRYITTDAFKALPMEKQDEWIHAADHAIRSNDYRDLLTHHALLKPSAPERTKVVDNTGVVNRQISATELSWNCPFEGDAVTALLNHVRYHHQSSHDRRYYGSFFSIVQSSGMGKSRVLDELSKTRFVIPMNLRHRDTTGYPPADHKLREFLLGDMDDPNLSYNRMLCFLQSLLETANQVAKALLGSSHPDSYVALAAAFRQYMTDGQSMASAGAERIKFYDDVVTAAQELLKQLKATGELIDRRQPTPKKSGGLTAFDKLNNTLQVLLSSFACPTDPSALKEPLVFLAFDECHTLTAPFAHNVLADGEPRGLPGSPFSQLRRALRSLDSSKDSATVRPFSFFLSTTGKISQVADPRSTDPSGRVANGVLQIIPPFIDLGFDQWMKANKIKEGITTITDVSNISAMANFGRPLFGSRFAQEMETEWDLMNFAQGKLLNDMNLPIKTPNGSNDWKTPLKDLDKKLACISRRLPVDFYSVTSTARKAEERQVEGHMRVCLRIENDGEGLTTVSPSEPLLSEAAARLARESMISSCELLKEILDGFSVNKGDRGEFICMQLLLDARDTAVYGDQYVIESNTPLVFTVSDFFKALFVQDICNHLPSRATASDMGKPFKDVFANSKMNFNHFIKVHQYAAIQSPYLVGFTARSAAVLCANNQAGIDGMNTFVYWDLILRRFNIGFILWQSKNDPKYKADPDLALFHNMDPYKLGILRKGDPPTPIIRIVFALASPKTTFQHIQYNDSTGPSDFTTFDYWCAGIDDTVFLPGSDWKENQPKWNHLLQASRPWQKLYSTQDPVASQLRRAANPLAATDTGHYSNWMEFKPELKK
ncbi:hypothetical protein Hypma_008682 [Hypsizygus marmoreus]|uniref:Uncharacterized protein n=1 Tax=Hypsizygus marmoreus TaxID=39966 RepID=A0A369JP42_HYPMA|nr:hypothetical protein Hypma_008682 [Hypsizygus marmoreus]